VWGKKGKQQEAGVYAMTLHREKALLFPNENGTKKKIKFTLRGIILSLVNNITAKYYLLVLSKN
jgi:hypothetical protein